MKISRAFGRLLLLTLIGLGAPWAGQLPDPLPADNLVGQLLVAREGMADPHFAHAVIYVVAHTAEGAMGLIVNREAGRVGMKRLLAGIGISSRSRKRLDVYYGGPVESSRGFVLHSTDYEGISTQRLSAGISLSTDADVLKAIAQGKGPGKSRFVLGYAGWGQGQLEREIARVDWLLAPADAALIFASDPGPVWKRALQRAGMRL